jgi:hypothetical protein
LSLRSIMTHALQLILSYNWLNSYIFLHVIEMVSAQTFFTQIIVTLSVPSSFSLIQIAIVAGPQLFVADITVTINLLRFRLFFFTSLSLSS